MISDSLLPRYLLLLLSTAPGLSRSCLASKLRRSRLAGSVEDREHPAEIY